MVLLPAPCALIPSSPPPLRCTDTIDFFIQPSAHARSDEELPSEMFSDLDERWRYSPLPDEIGAMVALSSEMMGCHGAQSTSLVDTYLEETLERVYPVDDGMLSANLMVNSPFDDIANHEDGSIASDHERSRRGSSLCQTELGQNNANGEAMNMPYSDETPADECNCLIKSSLDGCSVVLEKGRMICLGHLFIEKACKRGAMALLKRVYHQDGGRDRAA
ncbi:hypothetical protein GUITHDRAFT_155104, partial [Guillardia theta CCMP2712]